MKHYAGLDVSLKETSVCIVDEVGNICREVKVSSHPEDLAQVLKDPAWRLARVGLEEPMLCADWGHVPTPIDKYNIYIVLI